nr:unknown [Zea mays]
MKLRGANSTEFDPATTSPCVIFMPEGSKTQMGATMRLGSRRTYFHVSGCKSAKLYGNASSVDERHRHRYEVNPDMVPDFEKAGLQFVGKDESGKRMGIVELPSHKFFIGAQFHPEFKSRPGKPSPLFLGLIAAASGQLEPLLQRSNPTTKACSISKVPKLKLYPTGPVNNPLNSLVNGYYPNGTGIHT